MFVRVGGRRAVVVLLLILLVSGTDFRFTASFVCYGVYRQLVTHIFIEVKVIVPDEEWMQNTIH